MRKIFNPARLAFVTDRTLAVPLESDRRRFLAATTSLAASALLSDRSVRAAEAESQLEHPICVFTKPFNSLSFDELAERIAELGFDGIEAPVRRGGHVQPDEVADKLPALVSALAKQGLSITVMTSDLNDPADPLTGKILKVAADQGIRRYRMGYLKYDPNEKIEAQLERWKRRLSDLAALNEKLGIRGVYQNHAGVHYFGGPLWDLRYTLQGIDPKHLGVAYDIRHATVEGGTTWPLTFRLLRPHIDTVYVKDFVWEGKRVVNTPLGEGLVDPKFFRMLSEAGYEGPISLHEEYIDHRDPELVPKHLAAIEKDFTTLKRWISDAKLS